jgi:hypothetical protein
MLLFPNGVGAWWQWSQQKRGWYPFPPLTDGSSPDAELGGLESLFGNDVACLWAFVAFFYIETDGLAFCQGFKTCALDGADVDEYVRAAIVLRNEAEAFGVVKPFYFACSHE